jgi:hypothetical protein
MNISPFRVLAAGSLLVLSSLLPAHGAEHIAWRDHMRNARYGEIVVVTGGPFQFVGHVYNTIGLNDCPEAAWKALDPKQLAKEWKARSVILNGPRYFMMDRISLANPGGVASFDGLQARHLADVDISLASVLRGKAQPYTDNVVKRTTVYVYSKGKMVYELLAPDGRVYVLQTYALIVDPHLTEADLASLGSHLQLPQGWKYQARKLDKDLELRTTGTAYVLQDNLENSYQRETSAQ